MNRPNWIGQTIGGRYTIQELLGQGGMSSVYKALDPNLQRVVAIKMIHPHLSNDPRFTARFEEEARAVAKLRHPNIVQVYDFNHDEDVYYMVQEYVPGETVQSLLRRLNKDNQRMPLIEVIKATTDVCNAIGYAHQFGMIHRDIKPANIMIDEHGQAILMDFGIVKLMEGEAHTTTGAVIGTVMYMPPELIRGERPDPRSDIYSLGVTLFELLNGKPPFEANSAMTLMMMHQNDPVPDLHQLRPEVPEDLIALVEKSLEKSRENRFQSASEMAAALKKIFDRLTRGHSVASTRIEYPDEQVVAPGVPRASLPTVRVGSGTPVPEEKRDLYQGQSLTGAGAGNRPPPQNPDRTAAGGMGFSSTSGATGIRGTSSTTTTGPEKKGLLAPILAGGGLVVILIGVLCLVGVGIGLRSFMNNSSEDQGLSGNPAVPTSTLADAELVQNISPSETPTSAPTHTPSPIPATPTAEIFPTATIPAGIPFVRINEISLDGQGEYVVDYETFEFTEQLPGQHIHFFFNTVTADQAGVPGNGPWILYGGPRPFTQYKSSDRPPDAWQMCALVANSNHSVQMDSGICFPLPDVTQVFALKDTVCRFGPGDDYPQTGTLAAFDSSPADGLSQDEAWWFIDHPEKPGDSCWVSKHGTKFIGDLAALRLVDAPPMPTGGPPIGDTPFVEIKTISVDEQSHYVVEYQTYNFTEELPGTHLHFFFDTTPADQTGITGGGARLMFGGPSPFTGYSVSDRPTEAAKICVLVANPDHTVITDSGNCFALPDVIPGLVSNQSICYKNPNTTSDRVSDLNSGSEVLALGVSSDQNWVYVHHEADTSSNCWIQKSVVQLDKDIQSLPQVNTLPAQAPTATPKPKKEPDYNY